MEYEEKTFEGLTLSQETVCGMAFSDCTFVRCSFSGVRFQQCAFRDCAFFRCKIINPEPERTQAKHLRFEGCSLAGVRWEDFAVPGGFAGPLDQLSGCELKYNSFFQLRLDGFDFSGQAVMGDGVRRLLSGAEQLSRLHACGHAVYRLRFARRRLSRRRRLLHRSEAKQACRSALYAAGGRAAV